MTDAHRYIRDLIHSTGSAGFGQFWGAMRVNFDGDTYLSLGGPQILDELVRISDMGSPEA